MWPAVLSSAWRVASEGTHSISVASTAPASSITTSSPPIAASSSWAARLDGIRMPKRIALPPDIDDLQRGADRRQLLAQPAQRHVQRVRRHRLVDAPGGALHRAAAHRLAGRAHQAEHDLQLG